MKLSEVIITILIVTAMGVAIDHWLKPALDHWMTPFIIEGVEK